MPICCGCPPPAPGNDHRLGGQRSAARHYLDLFGRRSSPDILENIADGEHRPIRRQPRILETGVATLPEPAQRRQRPQPHLPLRLYRQQVRVPDGGLFPVASLMANYVLNTIVADSSDATLPTGWTMRRDFDDEDPAHHHARPCSSHGRIIFNGNNYTDEWVKEAEKRGLPNLPTTVDAGPDAHSTQKYRGV